MNLPLLTAPTGLMLLFKWTCLLALGWAAHALLRHRHARWRLILWRSVLCFSLALPLAASLGLPGIRIPFGLAADIVNEPLDSLSPITAADTDTSSRKVIPAPATPAVTAAASAGTKPINGQTISAAAARIHNAPTLKPTPALLAIWAIGCLIGTIRLLRLQSQLNHLRAMAQPATEELDRLARQVQNRLGVCRAVTVLLSDAVASPFVCGVWRPAIILPRELVETLAPGEISALLNHEMAHLRRHDLPWCVAWRWLQTIAWFHPLVWRIPAAHNLACEQEADRLASAGLPQPESYTRLLAQLALRILALPAVETRLTVNGSSQIARRLQHLGRNGGRWHWRHTAAALGGMTVLFLAVAGCQPSSRSANGAKIPPITFDRILVTVHDENGLPIAGATVEPTGFRVKGIHAPDAYNWIDKKFGPPEKVVTDASGRVFVKYPVNSIPEEKEYTGALILKVSHPEYASDMVQTYMVDGSEAPIHLARGIHLNVSGHMDADHQPVPELVVRLSQDLITATNWAKQADGSLESDQLSPGMHLMQLMGRTASGQIVYSDTFEFTAVRGQDYRYDLEMKPGIRVEGRLDDKVPRPVKNGHVLIDVRPPQFPAWTNWEQVDDVFKKYSGVVFWRTYRPVAEDGTFVFEAVPPGELDVVAVGDGFVSQSGGFFMSGSGTNISKNKNFCLPQPFALTSPVTKVEVATEPSATLDVTVKNRQGQPVPGATIYLNPNVVRMGGIFGNMRVSDEAPFYTPDRLTNSYEAITDQNGEAIIRNVPAYTGDLEFIDPHYQVPLQNLSFWRNRFVPMHFTPGETNHFDLAVEPKGTDYIGKK